MVKCFIGYVVNEHPNKRWTDSQLREIEIEPSRVRRWFKKHHGMTFHSYLRARRLATALGQISTGNENSTSAALANGYGSLSGFREAFKNWFGHPPMQSKTATKPIVMNRILTELGPMVVAATNEAIVLLEFADRRMLETQLKRVQSHYQTAFAPGSNDLIAKCESQLAEYFSGERETFSVALQTPGSQFQQAVWSQLQKISYGETTSYEKIAKIIGRSKANRAVGTANGANRIAILIPCHRVIRSDGSISGYGGGIWRKKWLLEHERQTISRS